MRRFVMSDNHSVGICTPVFASKGVLLLAIWLRLEYKGVPSSIPDAIQFWLCAFELINKPDVWVALEWTSMSEIVGLVRVVFGDWLKPNGGNSSWKFIWIELPSDTDGGLATKGIEEVDRTEEDREPTATGLLTIFPPFYQSVRFNVITIRVVRYFVEFLIPFGLYLPLTTIWGWEYLLLRLLIVIWII